MTDPRIYLAVDNCFASKRWTKPIEWMNVIKSLGLYYVEASADTECDPLYMGDDYMKRWANDVVDSSVKTSVKVTNLYSGHGTYATLGLAHTDAEVRLRFLEKWLMPMAQTAASVGAGLGFFCHAFSQSVLNDPDLYSEFKTRLFDDLAALASFAKDNNCSPVGVEQMYSPHQIPWTVDDAKELIREVSESAKAPFYITIDTGHQSGQRRFLRPDSEKIAQMLQKKQNGDFIPELWLGSSQAFDIFDKADPADREAVDAICDDIKKHGYMFAGYDDGCTYRWLSELGRYSPIIHLQQTDGVSSSHLPFTPEYNEKGIIKGEKVISSLYDSFINSSSDVGMPPCPDKIYLTLEMFTGTAAINRTQLDKMSRTVEYWRRFIPRDGMKLSELKSII